VDQLIVSLGPSFAAGFAVQRLLEIADPLVNVVLGSQPARANAKRVLLALLSLVVALVIVLGAGLRVLKPLGVATGGVGNWIDVLSTALVISAGTEGINSILKFLGYAKEDKKAQAASEMAATPGTAVAAINPGPNPSRAGTTAAEHNADRAGR
jgi:hypothetical protein